MEEGADILIVKPALAYQDIIREVADMVEIPVAAYSVSGEYAMIKAAASLGYVDEAAIICETAVSAYRAGVDLYLTYFAPEIAKKAGLDGIQLELGSYQWGYPLAQKEVMEGYLEAGKTSEYPVPGYCFKRCDGA